MQTRSASVDEDIGPGERCARAGGPAAVLLFKNSGRTGRLSDHEDGAALGASLVHGENGPLGSHRTTATYAALQSMPMTPARRRRFAKVLLNGRRAATRVRRRPRGSFRSSWESAGTAVGTGDRAMLRTGGTVRLASRAGAGCESGTRSLRQCRSRTGRRTSCRIRSRLQLGSDLDQDGRGDARCAVVDEHFVARAGCGCD